MNQTTKNNTIPYPILQRKKLLLLDSYFEEDNKKDTKLYISTKLPNLDVALDGGINKGLYVLMATEQKSKLAFITQLAEAFAKQDYGILFITPQNNISILTSYILSRQTRLFDFNHAKSVDEASLFSANDNKELSNEVKEQMKLLTKYMAVIDSIGMTPEVLKTMIEPLFCNHDKFVCFFDCSIQDQNGFLHFIQDIRPLIEDLAIPIVVYSKVPIEDNLNISSYGCWMDRLSSLVDYSILLNRHDVNGNLTSMFGQEDDFEILYESNVMPTYSAPQFRKCFLSFNAKYGLFSEA